MPSFCQNCQCELPPNSTFCLRCGAFAPLEDFAFDAGAIPEEPDSVFATCAACNTPLNSNTGVCPVCYPTATGPRLPPLTPASEPDAPSAVTADLLNPPKTSPLDEDFVLQDLPGLHSPPGSEALLQLEVEPASGPTSPSLPELPPELPALPLPPRKSTVPASEEGEDKSLPTLPLERTVVMPQKKAAEPKPSRPAPVREEELPLLTEPFNPPELDPGLDYLLQLERGGRYKAWPLRRPYYSVGRERCKILLQDRCVSRRHMVVIRAGASWMCINLSDKKMRVNGWELRQRRLTDGDVIRIGDTWLVYLAASDPVTTSPLRLMAGKWPHSLGLSATIASPPAPPSTATQCTLLSGATVVGVSRGETLLLGSHPVCDVVLEGDGVAPVHALLSWMPSGLLLFDTASGLPLWLDGQPARREPVVSGQTLQIGEHKLSIRLSGDPTEPGRVRLQRLRDTPPEMWVTVIFGPHAGETAPLTDERAVVLGKEPGMDLVLPRDTELVPFRLQLRVRPGQGDYRTLAHEVVVRQMGDVRPVVINRVPMEKTGKMKAGDVLQFGTPQKVGPTTLLVHYDPRAEEW